MDRDVERDYVVWQNRSLDFYLGARVLSQKELFRPAVFCAAQAVELLLKATLIFHQPGFDEVGAGHAIGKMFRMLRNRLKSKILFDMPRYFFEDRRFQFVSRYPTAGKGVGIPNTLLADLDDLFFNLVTIVPFQFNSELVSVLRGHSRQKLLALRGRNTRLRRLRRVMRRWTT